MTNYFYNNKNYYSFTEIRKLFPNISFPSIPTQDDLIPFGIEMIEETHSPTQEETLASYIIIVQNHLDNTAQARGYDGIISLCSYKGSTDPVFNKEGTAGVIWRDIVWRRCYDIRDAILAGTRDLPTDIISELPVFTWGD